MFAIVVEGQRRACFETVAGIGRSTSNDLVLPNPNVSRHHARISLEAKGFVVRDLSSRYGTWIADARVTEHTLGAGERIRIGPFTLVVEPDAAPDPVETRLLAAITDRQDATSRLVYADWLEERGDAVRAEFLRIQEALVGATDDLVRTERLRLLASSIEIKWRHAVARPAVENCGQRFNFKCSQEWGSLALTEQPAVRFCDGCRKQVYYCPDVATARHHAEIGHCVAVDIIPLRRANDLEPPVSSGREMGMIAPPEEW